MCGDFCEGVTPSTVETAQLMPVLFSQGAVPKGNATKEFIESLQLKPGQVVYKCPKCCSIKPDRAHHCRYHPHKDSPLMSMLGGGG